MKQLITVIIPAYNCEKTIEKCLGSVVNQSFKNFKVIVVNDGSTDSTLEKICLFDKDRRIEIINKKNEGVSKARNLAMSKVRTKYVTFVDSDDFVSKDFLANLIKGYTEDEDIGLSLCGVRHLNEPNKPVNYVTNYKSGIFSQNQVIDKLFYNNGMQGYLWNKLWLMKIITENNLKLDENISMAEDLLFTVSYLKCINKVYINNTPDYVYVHRQDSLSSGISFSASKSKVIKTNEDFLTVCLQIEKLVSDPVIKDDAKAFSGRMASNFLRIVNARMIKDADLDKYLRDFCKERSRYVLMSKTANLKNKIGYILTLFAPALIKSVDKRKS